MNKVLITGCNGQLGRALNKLLANKDIEIINTDVDNLDICDAAQVSALIKKEQPDTIINCAAHTAVDKCETDRENAARINALGLKIWRQRQKKQAHSSYRSLLIMFLTEMPANPMWRQTHHARRAFTAPLN